MARRMFSTKIVNSDPFFDMPLSTQALYFHLGMHADDEGFVYPKHIMRQIGAGDDELKILLGKKFILPFESGVMVIKHWNVNNTIRSDRVIRTTHEQEKHLLELDSGGSYHLIDDMDAASRSHKKLINQPTKELEVSTKQEQPIKRGESDPRVRSIGEILKQS